MEEVKKFKYLGTVLFKYGVMDREIRETDMKDMCAIKSLIGVMK